MESVSKSTDQQLEQLAEEVQLLADLCARLKSDNQTLQEQNQSLSRERSDLIEKNELARSRIEAMIVRLKAMEIPR
ncbi:MAG TPA: TIGR02449 family protein [Gammaproteobacteria bacterium]|nr:TIGR02449 family protein [Gammaproteobacteria bacterium]